MELSRIEIITGMSKFNGLKSALSKAGVRGMTVTQVLGQFSFRRKQIDSERRAQPSGVYRPEHKFLSHHG